MNRPVEMADQNLFGLAHPEFYEALSYRQLSSEFLDLLRRILPDNWALQRSDIWVHAVSPDTQSSTASGAIQGFKIHVSSMPSCALEVIGVIAAICSREGVDFKVAGDFSLLHFLNSKHQSRGSSGKFMTIYPSGQEAFVELIERFYRATSDRPLSGPYILSDRRYKDSKLLYYRYGGFSPPHKLNVDGTRSSYLVSPEGEYVPDHRLPYFQLPDWVSDPFFPEPDPVDQGNSLFRDRFRIEGALGFSNSGGIYFGTDTATEQPIVIKEARPGANCWSVGERSWDAVYLLEREYEVLRRLEDLGFVAKPIELFRDWEHTFLVEERLEGLTLDAFWAQDQAILAPYIRRPGRIESFLPKFKHVAGALLRMVTEVHRRGVLLGDLSPRNVLIHPETLRMWLIDFESAALFNDDSEVSDYASQWGTPGYMNPARASRNELLPEDDIYAAGMILYNAVVPINYLFTIHPAAEAVFLDRLIALGVPLEVRAVIDALLCNGVEEAWKVLDRWNP